jgi:alkylated DNA repair dioxygenase AlkB
LPIRGDGPAATRIDYPSRVRERTEERGKGPAGAERLPPGLHYDAGFVSPRDRAELLAWLGTLHPIWEERHPRRRTEASGERRALLRPVYWLGSWQFACLDYYRPPERVRDRCVEAEPFPPVLARLVAKIEREARRLYRGDDLPAGWTLGTCLVNLYGAKLEDGRRVDRARVGEHRDFEPGPVASISLGERALFEFVTRGGREAPARVVERRWLDDGSLLLFGGERWKKRTLHRVLRVERRGGFEFPTFVPDFETRRVNLTLRYVPREHVAPFAALQRQARDDVREYVEELARHSPFFARALAAERA